MAVNGIEIKVGQVWRTRGGSLATVVENKQGLWSWRIRCLSRYHSVTEGGFLVSSVDPTPVDLAQLIAQVPNETQQERFAAADETAGHIDLRQVHAGANAVQVGGGHYKAQPIQPWDYILANGLGFLAGNVVKYVSRFDKKNGVEDLKKARHYLDKLIESEQAK